MTGISQIYNEFLWGIEPPTGPPRPFGRYPSTSRSLSPALRCVLEFQTIENLIFDICPKMETSFPHTSSSPNCPTVHHSPEKSTITIDAEKQVNPWDSYEEDEMPEETQPHLVRNLRLQAFSIYRRLFSVAFLTDMGIFISYAIRSYQTALVAVANIFFAILMRHERVINSIACSVPQSWPFFIRPTAARVCHNGGNHSGAAAV
ncbi:uncharacterized protein BT62DRAFT_1014359 [Guyanagaster necrorhizus]|uniref:Uncharacterized protein n=1 Tax=Guyanagaster necrorhizus TaxID=856835 RepID=A0A9P7VEA3_9AGAR|nr:uncharacterized protein BT62DRAFT_1014359 [Guyanagaster necrorhizus MCA 3950]KAG7439119.1 hypothetical protein BT62DRAFT_1014359 [Guyanagaster necrorhizus MCA 3950]